MISLRFEHRITLAYLAIGSLWILFSDKLLGYFIKDIEILSRFQTYKGWFYVIITALLFLFFLKKHLAKLRRTEQDLEHHKNNLQQLVEIKTRNLDSAIEELSDINNELSAKNKLINLRNTELQNAMRDLKNAQARLIQADKMASLGVLTAGIAHEINNPLNYIKGGLTGLENYFGEHVVIDRKVSLFLKSIHTGVERAVAIVSGLGQLSRSKESYEENCNIHEIIENSLNIINNQIKDRVLVRKNYMPESPVIFGNVGELHQVFINILVNASQAIEAEGEISITTGRRDGIVSVFIKDNGVGISSENIGKITEPFFTTKEPGSGTGLGLSISYNIVQAHKGEISFESEPGKGTTVKLLLPDKKNEYGKA